MWPDAETTQELLEDARAGDRAAIGALLARHREALRRMIELRMDRRLQRRLDASDIVQDVLVDADRRLADYLAEPALPFHLWLRQMALDRLIDAHRRHRGAARRSLDREQPLAAPPWNEHSTHELAARLCDPQPTPAAAATLAELKRRFAAAVDRLEPRDRDIVLMRHVERLSNGEVARAIGLSPPAASMRYLRAMRRLRELLAAEESSPGEAS
jgi:RNA polymerase sigma-70 factor (ECF subfamily)